MPPPIRPRALPLARCRQIWRARARRRTRTRARCRRTGSAYELIEGVRILKSLGPQRAQISEDDARRAAAERAREQAESVRPGGDRRSEEARINRAGGTIDHLGRGSTNTAHLLRRVARTSPDTLADYEAGKHASARAAAKAAGIRVTETVALGRPATVARRIAGMGEDYARAVIAALQAELGA